MADALDEEAVSEAYTASEEHWHTEGATGRGAIRVAIQTYLAALPKGEPESEKAKWQAWARRRLDTSTKFWLRAAKKALDGDMRELRNRVNLAEAEPLDLVLSAAPPAGDEPVVAVALAPDPYDEREGPYFSQEDLQRLRKLPVGTKLYSSRTPTK